MQSTEIPNTTSLKRKRLDVTSDNVVDDGEIDKSDSDRPLKKTKSNDGVTVSTQYRCSLTGMIMTDPVIAEDTYTYQRYAITKKLAKDGTSPKTGEKISTILLFNRALSEKIEKFLNKHGNDPR